MLSINFAITMSAYISEDELNLFYSPARIIVAGFSGSGKTHIVCKIIEKYNDTFQKIIICGVPRHPLQLHKAISHKVSVYSNIINPLGEEEEEEGDTSGSKQTLFILDDIFIDAVNSKYVVNAFTKGRHSNLSTILITQNLFFSGKYARNISLNATHYLLLKQRDMNQIECLGRQIYGNKRSKDFLQIYQTAIKRQPYGYLLVDLSVKTTPAHQFRTNIVGEHPFEVVLQWRGIENENY